MPLSFGFAPRRQRQPGFTLVEVLVALAIMAVLALLSWRGIDGMTRAQQTMRVRSDSVASLQAGLDQLSSDLQAMYETQQVSAIDFDGKVLRITRTDSVAPDHPVVVVAWTNRTSATGAMWSRWQSPPLRNRSELLDAWNRAQLWANNASNADQRYAVDIARMDGWQLYFYRNNAWTNPQSTGDASTASSSSNNTATAALTASGVITNSVSAVVTAAGITVVTPPDGVRLVLQLSAGQPISGTITKDWVRPTQGGGKS